MTPIMLLSAHSPNGHDVEEHHDASFAPPPQPVQQPAAQPPASAAADTIEQVRELLYGDAMRNHGRRVEDLNGAMRDLEQRLMRRLDEMQNTIDALARSVRVEQSSAVRSIGLTLAEVGRQIAATAAGAGAAMAASGTGTGDQRGERADFDGNA